MSSNDWLGAYSGDYDQPKNGERLIRSLEDVNDTLRLILTELQRAPNLSVKVDSSGAFDGELAALFKRNAESPF